jgi:hypothetical protein
MLEYKHGGTTPIATLNECAFLRPLKARQDGARIEQGMQAQKSDDAFGGFPSDQPHWFGTARCRNA